MGSQRDPDAEGASLLSNGQGAHGASQVHDSPRASRLRRAVRHCIQHEPLLLATLLGVAVGVVLGTALSFANLPSVALEIIGLPGELLMRTLKMLVLPLITASVMAGVCALRQSTADMGKVARYTLLYYFSTTMGAVVLGIAIVGIVRPGRGAPFDQLDPAGGGVSSCHAANQQKVASHAASTAQRSPVEAFLGVIVSAFPDNIFQAAVSMNVLGIITVSLLMGAALSCMGPEAAPMVALINIFNDAISKIVNWVIWTSPVGIASLITTSICRACNLASTLVALGLFILSVLVGLLLWGFVILPLIYYATTRRNPGQVYRGFSQAMATAFGTDSSNATLPITMRSAIAMGCDPRIVQFFLPLGTTVNMNGTALYEAVTVIFIAQSHGVVLGAAGTVIVALTATLAAVGAAGIPSAGLVTMLMVLQAVELEQFAGDIAIILAVDWFLDRCRTVVNVLGDSFGTVIIDHHARNWMSADAATSGTGKASSDDADGAPGAAGCGIEMAPQPYGQRPGGEDDERDELGVHQTHQQGQRNHHNHCNHHGGGLFHHSRVDPEGVRQGLLAANESEANDGTDASGDEPQSQAQRNPLGGPRSGVVAAAAGIGSASGSGSGSASALGSLGHISGQELHHRHPHGSVQVPAGGGAGGGSLAAVDGAEPARLEVAEQPASAAAGTPTSAHARSFLG